MSFLILTFFRNNSYNYRSTIGKLAELLHISRKVHLPYPIQKVFLQFREKPRFEIFPLTQEVIEKAIPLNNYEMHDALIMATAMHLSLPLMTDDGQIKGSGLVETI